MLCDISLLQGIIHFNIARRGGYFILNKKNKIILGGIITILLIFSISIFVVMYIYGYDFKIITAVILLNWLLAHILNKYLKKYIKKID